MRDFTRRHADAATPLGAWLRLARHGRFQNLVELKHTFGSVDMVSVKGRELYGFNIGGNKYRLAAAIHFNTQRLFVRDIVTHAQYVTERWRR